MLKVCICDKKHMNVVNVYTHIGTHTHTLAYNNTHNTVYFNIFYTIPVMVMAPVMTVMMGHVQTCCNAVVVIKILGNFKSISGPDIVKGRIEQVRHGW